MCSFRGRKSYVNLPNITFILLHCTCIIILFVNVTCLLRYHYQIKYLICIACSCAEMVWQYECTVFCQANKAHQIEKNGVKKEKKMTE